MKHTIKFFLTLFVASIFLNSCNKDEEPGTEFDQINNWMYSTMGLWYYWTDDLPSKPNTNTFPGDFFETLKVSQDRFSFYYEDFETLVDLLNGVVLESGYEYRLFKEPGSESNVSIVLWYVKSNSPAADVGLQRGDVIYSINGEPITLDNYTTLLDDLDFPYNARYRRYNFESEEFEDQGQFSITPIKVTENPFLLDSIYDLGGKKIGYLAYTRFINGPTEGSAVYVDEMDMIFSNFQSQGVNEFILDLRFNRGGSETSARNLASLLVNGSSEDIMFKKEYNEEVQDFFMNDDRYGPNFLNIKYLDKTQNIGTSLNRVHVITTSNSASASELLINSLKPYMDVVIVGDTTVGKDVGSTTFTDDDNPNNSWAIQPIIVKIINAESEDYPGGLIPNIYLRDNFYIHTPLGDTDEPLLNAALSSIGVQEARQIPIWNQDKSDPLFESISDSPLGKSIYMEKEILPPLE